MKKTLLKALLSIIIYTVFAIVIHLCSNFIWIESNNVILFLSINLIRLILCLGFVLLCIWIIYTIWHTDKNKVKTLILSAIISPVMIYILGIVIILSVIIITGEGGL